MKQLNESKKANEEKDHLLRQRMLSNSKGVQTDKSYVIGSPEKAKRSSDVSGFGKSANGNFNRSGGEDITKSEFQAIAKKLLFFLIREGHSTLLKEVVPLLNTLLIREGSDTLLTVACKSKRPNILRYLLSLIPQWGGDKGLSEELNSTAVLNIAVQNELGRDIIEKLFDADADPNYLIRGKRPDNVETPLIYAICSKNHTMVKLLLVVKADPHVSYNTSPVRWAVRAGDTDILLMLLRMGADVLRDAKGMLDDSLDDPGTHNIVKKIIRKERDRQGYFPSDSEEE